MAFIWRQKILFKHCDPAGIVFYPRYVEMLNDCVEAFFSDVIDFPFEDFHKENGMPTVKLEIIFRSPGRHGEWLDFKLQPMRLGRSSLDLSFAVTTGDELKLTAKSTLVYTNRHTSCPWPEAVRLKIHQMIEDEQ